MVEVIVFADIMMLDIDLMMLLIMRLTTNIDVDMRITADGLVTSRT